ncbi:MAG: hypothetical protein UDG25_03465 [Lachnospiraceae bacterium]|nr:hypothetical protein [Lachnospiraceae bacterium]
MVTGLGASSLTSVSINAEDKNLEESDEKGINKNGNNGKYGNDDGNNNENIDGNNNNSLGNNENDENTKGGKGQETGGSSGIKENEDGKEGEDKEDREDEEEKEDIFELTKCSAGDVNLLNNADGEILIFKDKGITIDIEFRTNRVMEKIKYRLHDELSGNTTEGSVTSELQEIIEKDNENKDNENDGSDAGDKGGMKGGGEKEREGTEKIYVYKSKIQINDGFAGNISFYAEGENDYKSEEYLTGNFIAESEDAAENNVINIDCRSEFISENDIPLFKENVHFNISAKAPLSGIEEYGITVKNILTGEIIYKDNFKREAKTFGDFLPTYEDEIQIEAGSGDYIVEACIKDKAGYTRYDTELFSVDLNAPIIEYKYIDKNISTNRSIFPEIMVTDRNISSENVHISLKGERQGNIDILENISIQEIHNKYDSSDILPGLRELMGENIVSGAIDVSQLNKLTDKCNIKGVINMSELQDDNYILTVEATDLTGNKNALNLPFTINKHGSVFIPDNNILSMSDTFTNNPADINITELNIDSFGDEHRQVLLYHNGMVKTLKKDVDYDVKEESEDFLNKYTYRIFNRNFKGNGTYSILINTVDKAGNNNSSDSSDICKVFRFCVDKSRPEIVKLSDDTYVSSEDVEYLFVINDNIALKNFEYSVDDGELIHVNNIFDSEEFGGIIGTGSFADDNVLNISLKPDGLEHSVYIKSYDMAGNTKDIVFRGLSVRKPALGEVYKKEYLAPALENVREVSENTQFTDFTILIFILVLSGASAGTILFLVAKRKRNVRLKNKK